MSINPKKYLILSLKGQHLIGDNLTWYAPDFSGYTTIFEEAGRYSLSELPDYIDRPRGPYCVIPEDTARKHQVGVIRMNSLHEIRRHCIALERQTNNE